MRYLFIIGFIFMVVAQWYAPLSMVYDSKKTIEEGVEYRFKTAPVDPSDPFRGKYITLNYNAETYNPADTNELHFDTGADVFATLMTDSSGFASILQLSAARPDIDIDYIKVNFQYGQAGYSDRSGDELIEVKPIIGVVFPFRRLYVEESKASEAEKYYWSTRNDSTVICYAKVRVLEGNATLVDVMVNDRSLMDIVREINTSDD
jgi:uncharacterized membrane-anchored protein